MNEQNLSTSAGNMSNLAARLAVALNLDGTLKTTVSASTFTEETETATRTSTTQFTLPADLTGVYEAGRAVRMNDSIYGHVLTSVFDTVTTVTLITAVVPASIAKLEYSFSPSELPKLQHAQLRDVETVNPTLTDTSRTKHVSDNDLKTLQDQITVNTEKTGITTEQAGAIVANTAKRSYPEADETKLATIAEGAEVNVQSDWDATSGDALILNKPSIPSAQVQSDWDASSGLGEILNKPTIPTVVSGTFTPAINTTLSGNITASLSGRYTRIGDIVTVAINMSVTNVATYTDKIVLTGLPYASVLYSPVSLFISDTNAMPDLYNYTGYVDSDDIHMGFTDDTNIFYMANIIKNGTSIRIQATYFTNA